MEREPWHKRLSVILSLTALLISVPVALMNVFIGIRGAEVVIVPPTQVVLYRDPGDGADVLSVAVPVFMINASAARGDVLLKSSLKLDDGPEFEFENQATPVQLPDKDTKRPCDARSNCISLPRLLVIEKDSDEVLALGPGGAQSRHLSFALTSGACHPMGKICNRFGDFDAAARALAAKQLRLQLKLQFHDDGTRQVTCVTRAKVNLNYLLKYQNQVMRCESSSVAGMRRL